MTNVTNSLNFSFDPENKSDLTKKADRIYQPFLMKV